MEINLSIRWFQVLGYTAQLATLNTYLQPFPPFSFCLSLFFWICLFTNLCLSFLSFHPPHIHPFILHNHPSTLIVIEVTWKQIGVLLPKPIKSLKWNVWRHFWSWPSSSPSSLRRWWRSRPQPSPTRKSTTFMISTNRTKMEREIIWRRHQIRESQVSSSTLWLSYFAFKAHSH